MKRHKDLSMASRGLRYKLKISFYLMSILPLLVSVYLVSNYILPNAGLKLDVTLSLLISFIIALIGFFVIKEVFDRILAVSTDAKMIIAGDIGRTIKDSSGADEVGDLGSALSALTSRIRSNMDELKNYSEKTTEINFAIQKRVLALSSLLQISSLVSQGTALDDIFRLTVEKARLLANSDNAYLLLRDEGSEIFSTRAADGINMQEILKLKIGPGEVFDKLVKTQRPLIADKNNLLSSQNSTLLESKFKLKNALIMPVYSKGKVVGVLGVGNNQDNFTYEKEDLELLDIFAKQISIAVENDSLIHKVEVLEIKDALTGLFNEGYIRNRLQEEIKRAITYQRPCAFVLLSIDDFEMFHQTFGSLQAESMLKKIAVLVKESISEIDRAGRFSDNEFAVVLPEKNKRRALEVAEDIRKKIEFSFKEESDQGKRITITGGVSENPLDGVQAQELIIKAKELIKVSRTQGRNRILI